MMKRLQKLAYIALGAVILLALNIAIPVFAAATEVVVKTFTAYFTVGGNPISIYVDGERVTPKDGNGNIVEPFVVDGTTYLPVRAVGEALGKSVSWDGATATVYIGAKPGETQYMTDVLPAYERGNAHYYKEYSAIKSGGTESFSMGGVKYLDGMTFGNNATWPDMSWAVWNLNGQYSSFTAVLGHIDGAGGRRGYGSKAEDYRFDIFCDGVLRESFLFDVDMLPKTVSVDLRGVMQLKIVPNGFSDSPSYAFGNPILK